MSVALPLPSTIARFQILASAVLFSSAGAAIKSCDLDALSVAAGRSAIAAMVLVAFFPPARRGWSFAILPLSICYAITMLLFVVANKLTTAANVVFLQSTSPLYVMLLSPWLLKEQINRRDLSLIIVFGAGLAVFMFSSNAPIGSAPRPVLGDSLAAIVGITWAAIMLGLRYLARTDGPGPNAAPSAVAAGNLLTFLVCLPAAAPLLQVSLKNGLILVYLGVFQIALAYLLLMKGVERVSAFEASLLLLLEPVLSPLWAWSLNGERVSGMTLLGGVVILGASAAQVLRPKKPMPVARVTLAPAIADPLPGIQEESERIHEANLDENPENAHDIQPGG